MATRDRPRPGPGNAYNRSFAGNKTFAGRRGDQGEEAGWKLRGSGGSKIFGRRSGLRKSQGVDVSEARFTSGFQYSDPIFHKGYDPLRLIEGVRPLVSSTIYVKKGGLKLLGSSWEKFYGQLRGSTVVLLDHSFTDLGGFSQNPPIVGMFNVTGCEISTKSAGECLVLRKPGHSAALHLRFESSIAFNEWEPFLGAAARQRRVTLRDFEVLHAIGKGASGKVFLVRDKRTGEKLALKSIDKASLFKSRSAYRHAVDERLMLELSIGQPFFTQLRYAFQTYHKVYFVTEFCEGGDLFYYLRTHGGCLKEAQARRLAAETILALEFIHSQGFIYRDLKPENVLLDKDGHVKLADFGLCKKLDGGGDAGLTTTICGTHTYAAPEMLIVRQYGLSIDLWTLGVFVYHTLRGRTPYDAKDIDTVVQRMNNDPIRFPRDASLELISLITSLLERKPENRLGCGITGVSELKLHPFFKDVDWKTVDGRRTHPDNLKMTMTPGFGGVPNFDLSEWKNVNFDEDELFDDGRCDDMQLWPIQRVMRHSIMDFYLVGYSFDYEYAKACSRLKDR